MNGVNKSGVDLWGMLHLSPGKLAPAECDRCTRGVRNMSKGATPSLHREDKIRFAKTQKKRLPKSEPPGLLSNRSSKITRSGHARRQGRRDRRNTYPASRIRAPNSLQPQLRNANQTLAIPGTLDIPGTRYPIHPHQTYLKSVQGPDNQSETPYPSVYPRQPQLPAPLPLLPLPKPPPPLVSLLPQSNLPRVGDALQPPPAPVERQPPRLSG